MNINNIFQIKNNIIKIHFQSYSKNINSFFVNGTLQGEAIRAKSTKSISQQKDDNTLYDTKHRASIIIPQWVDKKIGVYNGKIFVPVKIHTNMIGHKLGEYSWPKKPAQFIKKTNKSTQSAGKGK